tara:strand:+ start:13285 stop:13617 length:333 start_codon:yes stop_codon:yes gene_type:complete
VEDEFLVDVAGHVFPVELFVELGADGCYGLFGGEEEGEGDGLVVLLGALFGQRRGAKDLCGGVGLVPGAEEDVVLVGVSGRMEDEERLGGVLLGRERRCISLLLAPRPFA